LKGNLIPQKKVDEDRNQIVAQYLRMGYLNASSARNCANHQQAVPTG
jgi:hypothetical protein